MKKVLLGTLAVTDLKYRMLRKRKVALVFRLVEVGATYSEIGHVLGISEAAARAQLRRGFPEIQSDRDAEIGEQNEPMAN